MGRRKAYGLPPQECCVQLMNSKVKRMGQGWQEEKGLCRESLCSNGLLGSSVMFTKHWASLDTVKCGLASLTPPPHAITLQFKSVL